MPLLSNGEILSSLPDSVGDLLSQHPHYKESAAELTGQDVRSVGPEGLLYVNQREYAVIPPTDDSIHFLGTEDATTCHILIFRHTGSGVTALVHLDGCDTKEGLQRILNHLTHLSTGATAGRIEVHIAGGFIDSRGESIKLTKEVFGVLMSMKEDFHLMLACVTDLNDEIKDEIHFPMIYGLGVDVRTGEIFRATFPEKGPDMNVRSACHFGGYQTLMNIYRPEDKTMIIGPYKWKPWPEAEAWIDVPDHFILRYLSTSPAQEPPDFVSHVRESLKVLRDHPNPHQTLFPGNMPWHYTKKSDGSWEKKS